MTVTPTSFDSAFGDLAREMIAENGRSLLLRQPTRVESQSGENAGAVVSSPLSVVYGTTVGDASVDDESISLSVPGVTGLLAFGDRIYIVGQGLRYTYQGDAIGPESDLLEDLEISPPLSEAVPDGTYIEFEFAGTFTAIKGVVSSVSHRWIASGVAKIGDLQVLVSRAALDAAGVTLAVGDELHLGATTTAPLYAIEAVLPLASGELDAACTVIARAR